MIKDWKAFGTTISASTLSTPLLLRRQVRKSLSLFILFITKSFRAPRKMYFVVPRDVSMELADLLNSPSRLKSYIQAHWNSGYSKAIGTQTVLLEGDLVKFVDSFDFSIFSYYQISEVIADHRTTAYWTGRFGGLVPPPPSAPVPAQIQLNESIYLGQLLAVYGEMKSCCFSQCSDLSSHPELIEDLGNQRERFFQAEAFTHHYRDETEPGTVEAFVEDIFYAIDPVVKLPHGCSYDQLKAAFSKPQQIQPEEYWAPHARPKTKQGVCHQLANSQRIRWVPKCERAIYHPAPYRISSLVQFGVRNRCAIGRASCRDLSGGC